MSTLEAAKILICLANDTIRTEYPDIPIFVPNQNPTNVSPPYVEIDIQSINAIVSHQGPTYQEQIDNILVIHVIMQRGVPSDISGRIYDLVRINMVNRQLRVPNGGGIWTNSATKFTISNSPSYLMEDINLNYRYEATIITTPPQV